MDNISLWSGDCLDEMKKIPDKAIDLILADLPYGTTRCKWDIVIPFDKLWKQYERVIKDNCAIVLFGSEPFASLLRTSNLNMYKYDWVWEKSKAPNFLNAKRQPLKNYETLSVFSAGTCRYYPQMTDGEPYKPRAGKKETDVYGKIGDVLFRNGSNGKRYPKAIVYFKTAESEGRVYHSTQKPVALLEHFIKTYSQEGDIVLDNTMGVGSTGVACVKTNRGFIGIEKNKRHFDVAVDRVYGRI